MRKDSKRFVAVIIAFSAFSLAMPKAITAAVPSIMNFQAILLDDQGQIVPDSSYDIVFTIHPDSVGLPPDIAIWTEVKTVETSGGLFNTVLGSTNPLTAEVFDGERWLQMSLASNLQPFLPRTRIGATPYTFRVASLDGSKGGAVSGKLIVDPAEVGRAGIPGRLSVIQGSATDGAVFQPYGSHGTSFRINDEAGNACVQLRPDNSGEGGWLYVHRNDAGAAGFTVEGNTAGTLEPSVRISGSTQSMEFDLTHTGSAAVALTPGAIDASEILEEPGVASNMESSELTIATSRTNLLSRAIVAPADGYVFVAATVELSVSNDSGLDSGRVYIGLTNDPAHTYDTLSVLVPIDNRQMDDYTKQVHLSAVLPVAAGVDTYYLFGTRAACSINTKIHASKRTLSVLYFPTQYGTVVVPSAESGTQNTSADTREGEARTAEAVNAARFEREVAAMKARLLELEQSMTEQDSDNPQR